VPALGGDIALHPVRRMIDAHLSVTIATDNRLVSDTTVTRELARVSDGLALGPATVKRLVLAGFKAAFFAGGYAAKRDFTRAVAQRIERLFLEAGNVTVAGRV